MQDEADKVYKMENRPNANINTYYCILHEAEPLLKSADNKNHNKVMDVESWTMDTDDGNVNGDGERVGCWVTWRSMRAHVREAAAQLILQIG